MTATRTIKVVKLTATVTIKKITIEVPVDAKFDETDTLKMKALFAQHGGEQTSPVSTEQKVQYSVSESD